MLKCAISPCPNDIYLFYAWLTGQVGKNYPLQPTFADIQQLNEWAFKKKFPLIKVSFNCFAKMTHNYQILPVGSALGFNCGPKIIAKNYFLLSELPQKKIAIPGKDTTAHLLLERLTLPPKEKFFCLYHEIMPLIASGKVDCGLIIHESRFSFQESGFIEICDLGEIWHTETLSPLPLGGMAIARETPDEIKQMIVTILLESLTFAQRYPKKGLPFILSKSQEKDASVILKHIETYINSETWQLSKAGISAISTLLGDNLSQDWLYQVPVIETAKR